MTNLAFLRQDLWARWKEQIGQVDSASDAQGDGKSIAYSKVPLFDLYGYTSAKFPAGGRLTPAPPPDYENYMTYRLDESGRPVRTVMRHVYNAIEWQGVYTYSDTEVVHVELNMISRLPSRYERLTLEDGLVKTFQRVIINGGATFGKHMSISDAIDFVMGDSRSYLVWIEEYSYDDRRRISASVFKQGMGIPERYSQLSYSYFGDGRLEKIVEHTPGVPDQTIFATKSKATKSELGDRLAAAIAERTIRALAKASLDAPLVAVELSYRSVDNYCPIVIPCTEADEIENLVLTLAIDPKKWIILPQEDFAPDIVDFTERLQSSSNSDAGSKMVRTAAKLVNDLARARLSVAENFVAYAADWEFELGIKQVLKASGVSQKQIAAFGKRGWLDW